MIAGPAMSLLANLVKSQQVVSFLPEATVLAATKTMADRKIGSVVVIASDQLTGIFTERDLLNRVVSKGLDPHVTPLAVVMSKEVCTSDITETVEECYQKMEQTKCRRLPILKEGKVVGMVTMRNILEWLVNEMEDENVQLKRYISS